MARPLWDGECLLHLLARLGTTGKGWTHWTGSLPGEGIEQARLMREIIYIVGLASFYLVAWCRELFKLHLRNCGLQNTFRKMIMDFNNQAQLMQCQRLCKHINQSHKSGKI